MASRRFELVKSYYDRKLWTKKMVKNAVVKGWITQDEYDAILGISSAGSETAAPAESETERLAAEARAKRDALLAASDYTQATDYPISYAMRTAWAEYRQKLRDITEQEGFPTDIEWPTEPESK